MIRGDALATLYCFHPLARLMPSRKRRVPILMYHGICEHQSNGKHPYYQTETTPAVFEQHMRYLRENGYTSVTPADAWAYLENPSPQPLRPVVITYDDGYEDFYSNAFPILSKYRFSATVYLPTSVIGENVCQFKGVECLTWSQVRELHAAGIEFGSHTVTHPQLSSVSLQQVEREVRQSKETIENKLGCAVTSFAYPYAFPETKQSFRESLRAMLTDTGYENGVTTIIGTADGDGDRFFMKRLPMNSYDNPSFFRAKLNGGYDWVHAFQYASKLLKAS